MRKQMKQWLIPCTAAAFTIGMSMVSLAATGWNTEGDNWVYYNSDGSKVTEDWKKSGSGWFYLDENGSMAKSRLIEDGENYYYVNSLGARVSNEWRELPNEDDYEEDAPETAWYYFGSTGRAYKASGSGKPSFKTITKANGEVKKYAFDDQGRMLFGWIDESGERQTGEDAWKTGVYYCGEASDGARAEHEWKRLDAVDDENTDSDFDETYWFYFDTNGKKVADKQKYINKGKYLFDENGAARYSWNELAVQGTPSDAFYNLPSQCWLATGWFKTVPTEEMNSEAYSDQEEKWFYYSEARKDLIRSQIKTINNYKYGFNDKGEMLYGLYKLKMDGMEIKDYEKIQSESDFPTAGDGWLVYYFGDSPKEGAMATGKTTVNLDGEKYTYFFRKTSAAGAGVGSGADGIYEGAIYDQGRLQKAENDMRYAVIEHQGKDYLVNTSGKVQKNKTNLRDADGTYYCTDKDGVVTYTGGDKKTK